jgi:two-component system OmpR family sensor kinase
VHGSLVVAVEECDRLAQLAEDLLVIARTADGRLPLRVTSTPAAELLAAVRDRFADRARRRGRAIRVEAEPGLVVRADSSRLCQALGNLVENALRHGDGDVGLLARHSAEGVQIDVTDEGPCFPTDLAGRAFERFARGDRARTGEGVGLGLSIVQAIAEAHGGRAAVVTSAHTTLRIHLPAS